MKRAVLERRLIRLCADQKAAAKLQHGFDRDTLSEIFARARRCLEGGDGGSFAAADARNSSSLS